MKKTITMHGNLDAAEASLFSPPYDDRQTATLVIDIFSWLTDTATLLVYLSGRDAINDTKGCWWIIRIRVTLINFF